MFLEYLVLVISDETASEVKSNVNSTFDTQMENPLINMNKGIWQLYFIVEAYLTFIIFSTRTPKELMYFNWGFRLKYSRAVIVSLSQWLMLYLFRKCRNWHTNNCRVQQRWRIFYVLESNAYNIIRNLSTCGWI